MKILEIFSYLEFIKIAKKGIKILTIFIFDHCFEAVYRERPINVLVIVSWTMSMSEEWRTVMKQWKAIFHFSLFHYVPFDKSRFSRILHTNFVWIVTVIIFIHTATKLVHSFYLHDIFLIIKTKVKMKLRNNKRISPKESSKLPSKLTGVKKSKFY